jgi:hypothetical protein
MFAFALYDRRRRKLFLARDGFGIKPLYVRRTATQISFASEIRALAHDGQGPLSVDPAFTRTYLRLGYVPSPKTAFLGIEKVAPGTFWEIDVDTGSLRVEEFYRLAPARVEDTSSEALVERLRELLNASVRRHLMADVPTGLFLSGGLDSSALTVFANHHGAPPKTFSMGFSSSDQGDETRFASAVARRAGNENVRIDLGPANLGDLDPIVAALEEPLADSAVLPLWYLCVGTATHVKVALSGEGGDEVLGGYARYLWGPIVEDLRPVVSPRATRLRELTARMPSRSFGPFNFVRRAGKLADSIGLPEPTRYLAWFDIFTGDERRKLVGEGEDMAAPHYEAMFAAADELGLDHVQRLQYEPRGARALPRSRPRRVRARAAAAPEDRPRAQQAPPAQAARAEAGRQHRAAAEARVRDPRRSVVPRAGHGVVTRRAHERGARERAGLLGAGDPGSARSSPRGRGHGPQAVRPRGARALGAPLRLTPVRRRRARRRHSAPRPIDH